MNFLRWLLRRIVPRNFHPTNIFLKRLVLLANLGVMSGVFKGMRYIDRSYGSQYYPKLMGTYEIELAEIVSQLSKSEFDRVIVAGSAEGYYAVGMAKWPGIEKVDAFEAQPEAHIALAELAELNHVGTKIVQHGLCDCSQLSMVLTRPDRTLLVVDIEGGESILLDPNVVPALREATLLVEMHDCFLPGLGSHIKGRFECSHQITQIDARVRTLGDLPAALRQLPAYLNGAALAALDEGRPPGMYWLFMRPQAALCEP